MRRSLPKEEIAIDLNILHIFRIVVVFVRSLFVDGLTGVRGRRNYAEHNERRADGVYRRACRPIAYFHAERAEHEKYRPDYTRPKARAFYSFAQFHVFRADRKSVV